MNKIEDEIKGLSSLRTNIPMVRTSFVGRQREIEEVKRLLASSRLVTLTGAAGCGKTQLALRAAQEVGMQYPGGVQWLALVQVVNPGLIAQTVAKALHVPEQPGRSSLQWLVEALQNRDLLLVLDNCEHVLQACAQLAQTLLAETDVSVLATSREPLGVSGERRYPLAPLMLPPPTLTPENIEDLGHYDAIRLFVTRAREMLPAFELTADNGSVVAEICRSVDGIPLAIELASARVNVLALEQIAARLENQFDLLPPAPPGTYSHHDTLRAAIDWSHDLLSKAEQTLLRRLSVFSGGCSLAMIQAVCTGNGLGRGQMLDLMASLVGKSLVVADTLRHDEARYSLLETIRQYAQEKLIAAGERAALRDRHLQYLLQLTEETEPKLRGEYQQMWLNWLEGEYDNIRAALDWSLESGQVEAGLRIAIAIYQFWTVRDYMAEGAAWLERLLARADEEISAGVYANTLAYAAFLAEYRGNRAAQMAYGEEATTLAQTLGDEDKPALIWALRAQAYGARASGDEQTGFVLYKQVVQLYRESGNRYHLGRSLTTCGIAAISLGKYDEARALLDEALSLARKSRDSYRIAILLNFSGDLARCQGDYDRAKISYEESISLLRELDATRDLASALHNLGHTCLSLGDGERARALFNESMALQQAQQNTPGTAECVIGFAALAIFEGLPATGARLLAAAVAVGGERMVTAWPATRMEYERYLAQAQAGLTEKAFEAEQAAGRALSLEQAVAYAEELARKATAAEKAREKLDDLTPRERQVAALIAQARSNGEIAEELVVSKRTVEKHIANIRSKLAFTKRAQIVRWAIKSRLVNASGKECS